MNLLRTQSGLHVTVGDDMGKIWVYDVGEALAIPSQVYFTFPRKAFNRVSASSNDHLKEKVLSTKGKKWMQSLPNVMYIYRKDALKNVLSCGAIGCAFGFF
jgi:hypothetical protein